MTNSVNRFDERAGELRSMLSWMEYQPCLRDGIAAGEVRAYLGRKLRELDELSATTGAASPVSEAEIEAFVSKVNNAINQMCDPLSPNFARNMVEVRAGMDAIRDRVVQFVRGGNK